MQRPSLAALEAFVTVARLGSFRRAAAEREVSASALSHVIRGLEAALKVRLFNRTSRSISLTEAGQHLLDRVGPALGDVGEALDSVGSFGGRPAGLLRLNVPRIATELVIAPMIGRFLATYPEVRVEVASSDGLVDIVAEGFDAGIRRDRRLAPGMIAVPVGPARRFAVVGAPSYLAGRAPPRVPQDLHAHAWHRAPLSRRQALCLGVRPRRRGPGGRGQGPADRGRHRADAACRPGGDRPRHGLREPCRPAARDGPARAPARGLVPGRARFFLYYPGRRQVPAPLRALIDMLRAPAS